MSNPVSYKSKADSRFMRILAFLLAIVGNKRFMEDFWTTVGTTLYYPTSVTNPMESRYRHIITHELVHVEQYKKWGLFYAVSYLLFPLPVGLAWFRWRWEREAYMVQLRVKPTTEQVEWVVETLWSNYAWTWPKPWMRKWFLRELRLG